MIVFAVHWFSFNSTKQCIITLIPKQEKNMHYLKHLKPINLLTVKLLYTDSKSCCLNYGYFTNFLL